MSEDKKKMDPELEEFFRNNKDMIERLLLGGLDTFKETYDEEKTMMEELAEKQKEKAKEAAQGVVNMITDPDVQKHFMAMGFEFIMGMSALMKAAPMPETIRDMAAKAEEMRKTASDNFCQSNPDCSKKQKSEAPEKIEIQSVPKKQAVPKKKTTPKAKPRSATKAKVDE